MPRGMVLALLALGCFGAPPPARIAGRVVDGDTGLEMPCSVTIRTAEGKVLTEYPGFTKGFRTAGRFEKEVPAGETTVTVRRGFDYGGATRRVTLRAGQRLELRFHLRRRTPLRKLGWYTGDSHVHMIHGQRTFTTDFPYVALAGRAEALDYMSLAQSWPLDPITAAGVEQACERASTRDFRLLWNMEAPKNYWLGDVSHCMGHGWMLGARTTTPDGRDVYAELSALSAHDYEREKPPAPNFESHALIHELGGIVSYTHPCRWWWGKWGGQNGFPVEERKFVSNMAAELPFDTVAGPTYDTIDVLMQTHEHEANRKTQQLWFMLLNHGYRIPATASSDATFDNRGTAVPGAVRVYTKVEGDPTAERIAAAMKAGRNFVTSGPLVWFEIEGRAPGAVIPLRDRQRFAVSIRAWASGEPGQTLQRIELIRNGDVVRAFTASGDRFAQKFLIEESGTAWYLVRCAGAGNDQVALTNPIYFESPDYRKPEPAPARVRLAIRDQTSGEPLDGACEVLRMNGRRAVIQSRREFHGGELVLEAPATARLRISAPGHRTMVQSIFADYAPLLEDAFEMRDDRLIDWSAFEKIKAMLADVRLEARLARE